MRSQPSPYPLSASGLLIALGVIFGDIGTSPLYVLKAISSHGTMDRSLIYGALSCIFWTLTLQTTIKYVLIALRADNKGEGGILALFSLVRRKGKWLILLAMLGGAALLADGMITPAITISSAVEGLQMVYPNLQTVPIVVGIVTLLFAVQRFGTTLIGRFFGPVMFAWFSMIGTIGFVQLIDHPSILAAVSPHYAVQTIATHPGILVIIGAVFLCTTGAEALYSDLGHCGRKNIQISWIFVKCTLLLSYFGQSAWVLDHTSASLDGGNPFYMIMPSWFLPIGIAVATLAAIIASQAMISGAFTLVSEAVRLNLWPKVKIVHPNLFKGQLFVPSANWILFAGCLLVIALFRESVHMEAAYGLAINISFLVTTVLLTFYLLKKHINPVVAWIFFTCFLCIELAFLASNLSKFTHGGWLTAVITVVIFTVMLCWWWAGKIKNRRTRFIEIEEHLGLISEIGKDTSIPLYASQLVYLTGAHFDSEVEESIIYSIVRKQPKRADVYWLVHVNVTDQPYSGEYKVTHLVPGQIIRVDFKLGFKDEHRISLLFREVVQNLVNEGEVNIKSKYESLSKHGLDGDFKFIVLHRILSNLTALSVVERVVLDIYRLLKMWSLSEQRIFGLDPSYVAVERVPLLLPGNDSVFGLKRLGTS